MLHFCAVSVKLNDAPAVGDAVDDVTEKMSGMTPLVVVGGVPAATQVLGLGS